MPDHRSFSEEQLAKIESAVSECVRLCDGSSLTFITITKFIDELKADPIWTADEIIEMQTRVLRIILYRQAHPEKKSK